MLPLLATHLLKLPLVAPVIVSAIPLGFGPGLLAVVLATLWADYRYALPEYDFAITEWEDVAGLAGFAIVGAFIAWSMQDLISSGE
jgi:K+-sensing histidine kinase KdpD